MLHLHLEVLYKSLISSITMIHFVMLATKKATCFSGSFLLLKTIRYYGWITAFESSITAVCANARPLNEAPVCNVIPV